MRMVIISRRPKNLVRYEMRTLLLFLLMPTFSFGADPDVLLVIKNHRFEPSELRIPAGKKVRILIDNQDVAAEEFESHELNREKVIPGQSKLPIFVGPLTPGRYPFYGDFNAKTAQGVVVAE